MSAYLPSDAALISKPNLLSSSRLGGVPEWALRAKGAYVWDESGRKFLDLMLGFGSVILGHADDRVLDSVVATMRDGISPTLRSRKGQYLCEKLVSLIPNAESCFILRSGSEATSLAVRVARHLTSRDTLIRVGYQGWHDWAAPRGSGIPKSYHSLTKVTELNDVEALTSLFERHGSESAALVVMPFDNYLVTPEYINACRLLCDDYGSLLILDEVRSGFRLSLGGAQEYFNVKADICCFSKALGNGHAIAALTGSQEVLSYLAEISSSSVNFRSTDGISAALATLDVLQGTDALDTVWSNGEKILQGITLRSKAAGIPVVATGIPPAPFHRFDVEPGDIARVDSAFYGSVWGEGLLVAQNHHWFVCEGMRQSDIDFALDVLELGYVAAAAAV